MIFKKKKKPKSPVLDADPDMVQPDGQNYLEVLEALHDVLEPEWYLEVGTQRGTSLCLANCNAIAIDPQFMLNTEVVLQKPSLHFLQLPSDDAFASEFFSKMKPRIDFAFLDGMHLFEYILRDFVNTERNANKSGVIAIHDCIPFNRTMAKRTWDKSETRQWTGDVWKIIPVLRALRPDLKLQVLDCAPTGLLLISDLDPGNDTLAKSLDKVIADNIEVDIDVFGINAFLESTATVDSKSCYAQYKDGKGRAAFGL